nr:DUF4405 domain-containing protein [uncultured Desulfobulbus sp.]
MTVRKITSLTLLLSFILLILTSLVLYVVPEGRVAYWSDWRWLWLSKSQWGDIHTNSGFLFLAAGLLHLGYNWKPIVGYLKNRAKQVQLLAPAMVIALVINLVVVAGTLSGVPPFQSILDFGHSFKDAAARKYGEPPYGHAELSPLRLFAKRTGLDLTTIQQNLTKAGFQWTGPDQTILAIAKANGKTPKAVYDVMTATSDSGAPVTLPAHPTGGIGQKALGDLCRQYGLDEHKVLAALLAQGIKAEPHQSLKEIAAAHNTDPHSIYELIYEAVQTR